METAVVKRVALEKDLRHVVTARQFVLHYQARVVAVVQRTGANPVCHWGQFRIKSVELVGRVSAA